MKYEIIYADPPWEYNDKRRGYRDPGAGEFYKTQKISWLKLLDINDICAKDATLWMWAVSPLLPEAIELMKCWGFNYKTVAFCWNKKTNKGNQVYNLGRYTMGSVELCLLGTRGKPQRDKKNVKQLIEAERKRHSQKPKEVMGRIVEVMGNRPRIELFAREKMAGWHSWGNEIESDIEIKSHVV